MEDQEMIQTFSPHTSQKTFADSICPAGVWYGVRSTLMPPWLPRAQNSIRISCRYPGADILAFTHTESPLAAVRATQESVGERVIFIWITFRDFSSMRKKAKSGQKKRSVTCKRIAGPNLCRMIAQEGLPGLSTSSKWRESAAYIAESFA